MALKDLVKITYGPTGGDETSRYCINPKKKFTVREFVDAVLKNDDEWGDIIVVEPTPFNKKKFNETKIEYFHGALKTQNFSDEILDREVDYLDGWGGWSLSTYYLFLAEKEDNTRPYYANDYSPF